MKRQSIAIIGSGISGMGCAHHLHPDFDIEIFEQKNYFGGHTNTVLIEEGNHYVPIDTGFIVCNFENYPNLMHLFNTLDVPLKKTKMSFSAHHHEDGIQYSGSSFSLLFAQRKNIMSPQYVKFLLQIKRFNKECLEVLQNVELQNLSITEYLHLRKYNMQLLHWYILPMTTALWSASPEVGLSFPIIALVRFFKNHGMLGLNTQYQWFTVHGGSEIYKNRIIAPFRNKMRINSKVEAIKIFDEYVEIKCNNGDSKTFDKVIIATHSDQAFALIKDLNIQGKELLAEFPYHANRVVLHTDEALMPSLKKIWSSWNYRIERINKIDSASTTYWMNSLQQVSENKNYFITLNDPGNIDEQKILQEFVYHHPAFTIGSMQAQLQMDVLNTNGKVFFCGSYFGNGFHEDAYVSALKVSEKISGKRLLL